MNDSKGYVIMPGLRLDKFSWSQVHDEARDLIDTVGPCGFIVFGGAADDVYRLTSSLTAHAGRKMLFAADLERGAGQQFAGLSRIQTPMAIAACAHADEFAYRAGRQTAEEALSVGINLIFAPVCDVNTEPRNPIINVRSFSDDVETVSTLAMEWIQGAQSAGALACAKHFPGHGGTWADSHIELPRGVEDESELRSVHLPPFYAAIGAGVGAIMTGHITVPARGEPDTPATLSPHIIRDLLRGTTAYEGLIITDALLMKGLVIAEEIAAVKALKAGCDILLYPTDPKEIFRAIERKIIDLDEPCSRIDHALDRVTSSSSGPRVRGLDLAASIARESLTMIRGEYVRPDRFVIHAGTDRFDVNTLRSGLLAEGMTEVALEEIPAVEGEILLAVFSYPAAWRQETFPNLEFLADHIQRVGIASFGDPYFLARHPHARYAIAAYDGDDSTQAAFCELIAGRIRAEGRCPVSSAGL